ncbi:MAG: NYN domain-containing protein [Piscinibacter sp.]|uniref:NYN domain-containing protein n=1 Tax=Piscinibacter sp. TaxID=1903157 RepID=UPI00258B378F|nr:NYN domain-containing protein [Piscinibacter sp.]MCW5667030.1 NYN domain-containing protein [Piscinibacter sp.]
MNGKLMLLIDADNVSADVVNQAVELLLAEHGAIHVRRAYCTAESAQKNLALFKRHSIRPMVNLSAGKNSTDIALAVDALDLVLAERPERVVIVSSDSDFAPLVIRLREKGCRVEGIGQEGKTGDETIGVYDAYTVLAHRKGGTARTVKAEKPEKPEKQARAAKPAKEAKPPRTRKAAKAAPPAPPPAPALPDDVERLLNALPSLRGGGELELRKAVEFLRAADLLPKNAPSTKLFRKHPEYFALVPEEQPNKVRFIGQAG